MLIRDTENEKINFMIMINQSKYSICIISRHSQQYLMKVIKNLSKIQIISRLSYLNTYPNDSMRKYVKISK